MPEGVGVIAATETAPADAPTPLATALVAALAGPVVRSGDLLTAVQGQLAARKMTAVGYMPARPDYLAGAPAPPPKPPPIAVVAPVAPPPPAPAPPAAAPPAPVLTVVLPDDGQMTDSDRRKVQGALLRL